MTDYAQLTQELLNRVRTPRGGALTAAAVGIASAVWFVWDYAQWKNFGTGGTPSTPAGYWTITKLRMVLLLRGENMRSAAPLEKLIRDGDGGPGFLVEAEVPRRRGNRPRMMPRPLPQRQRPEPIDPEIKKRLYGLMERLQSSHPSLLSVAPSKTEGGTTTGLYANTTTTTTETKGGQQLNAVAAPLAYEIAHVHPSDHALHVFLSPRDAAVLVRAGWAERFPLDWVPHGWSFVYAPRDDAEMEVVESVVRAAVAYITGVQV